MDDIMELEMYRHRNERERRLLEEDLAMSDDIDGQDSPRHNQCTPRVPILEHYQ